MKYLGIDYGEAKIGLAIGDDETRLALPYKIISNSGDEKLFNELKDLIRAEAVDVVVVGFPLNLRGQISPQTSRVEHFFDQLKEHVATPVVLHDERFSSREAKKLNAGKRDDDVAAMIMLQNYLDSQTVTH